MMQKEITGCDKSQGGKLEKYIWIAIL